MQDKIVVPYLNLVKAHKNIYKSLSLKFNKVLNSGSFIMSEELSLFEKEYASFSKTKYCVGVACGLDALTLSLKALGVGPGDEVIVPSNTYIATLIAISLVGATPILVEPNLHTYNINPQNIEKAITKKTKAIIPVHLFGQACQMNEIVKIAQSHKLFIVEDNAQSHGAKYNGKITGSFGNLSATSFYPGKNLGALGDAGAVTTDDKSLAEKVYLLRNYGSKVKYYNDIIGYNSRLDELQAAFLRIKLKALKMNNEKRIKIASYYIQNLKKTGDIILPEVADKTTHVYHVFTIRTKKRNSLQKFLFSKGIQTLIHYPVPPHLSKAYKFLNYKKGDFPVAEELANTSLSIPIYPELTAVQINYVIRSIKEFFLK